eukprot:PhM_4_TR11963/c0_g1_i1/m.30973
MTFREKFKGKANALTPQNLAALGDVDRMLDYLVHANNAGMPSSGDKALAMTSKSMKKPKEAYDCLANDNKTTHSLPTYDGRRCVSNMSTASKGVSFAGKDAHTSRYYGKGFAAGTSCSPGPIYGSTTSIADTTGQSFPKSQRMHVDSSQREKSNTPAPGSYDVLGTVGHRQLSGASSVISKFSSAPRFAITQAENITPGPGHFDNDRDPSTKRIAFDIAFGHAGKPQNLFISRQHVADALGLYSPGPGKYDLPDPSKLSTHASATSAIIKKPETTRRAHSVPPSSGHGDELLSDTSFQHSHKAASPGPAAYSPNVDVTRKVVEGVSFTKATVRSKGEFIGKQFMGYGADSPGPQYLPPVHPNTSGTVFADPDNNMGRLMNRFHIGAYHGKGIGEVPGVASPGPAQYTSAGELGTSGPHASLGFKERDVDRPVIAGPKRARFVNKDISSKENFGVFSPGPKYMLKGSFDTKSVSAATCTFGLTDRHFQEMPPEHRIRAGADKFECPGDAMYLSPKHSKAVREGKWSFGHLIAHVDESKMTSKYKCEPSVTINAPRSNASRKQLVEEQMARSMPPPIPLDIKDDVTRPDVHVHRFPTPRRGGTKKPEVRPGPGSHSSQPVTKHQKVISIGPLGGVHSPPKRKGLGPEKKPQK